jgi:hypothetical protein
VATRPRAFNDEWDGPVLGDQRAAPGSRIATGDNAGLRKKAGPLMSSRPVQAIASQTLRHWTIDSQEFVVGSPRPAPVPHYAERAEGGQFQLLASKLAQVKSVLARQTG